MAYGSWYLVALAASALLGVLPQANAAEPDPVFDIPVFNNPTGSVAEQYTIFQQLARMIDRVPAGETISMSWLEFKVAYTTDTEEKPNIPQRLVKAHQRGVNVRIVLDNNVKSGSSNTKLYPYKTLAPVLGTNVKAPSYIVVSPDKKGAIAKRKIYSDTTSYNHNKFLQASKMVLNNGTVVKNAVFQSSGNLGTWDADTAFNNAITFTEAEPVANYKKYFGDLAANYNGKGNDYYYWTGNTASKYRTHFFPRHETNGDLNQASTDTIVSVLNSVKCSYKGENDGKTHQTDVRIVMWAFTRVAVAEKLAALVRAGCWVDIAYSEMSDGVHTALKKTGGKKIGVTKCAVPWQGRNVRPHSKYMLIDGAYDDDQIPRVYMGSHNYAMSALRNADESLVRIRSADVHSRYLHENFYKIRDMCSGKTPPK